MTPNVRLDRSFIKIEKRGLVFLLQGDALKRYLEFLDKPRIYREYIRELEKDDWW